VTPKSDRHQDQKAAQLSELTIEYLWEALKLPDKMREVARILMYCGTCWMEVFYDETRSRRMQIPATEEVQATAQTPGAPGMPPIPLPLPARTVPVMEGGAPVYKDEIQWGEIVANIVSPFELHFPTTHRWDSDELGWIVKEWFMPLEVFREKFKQNKTKKGLTKANGWFLDRLEKIKGENVRNIPLWWWERLAHLIEGAGPTLNIGTPDQWEDHAVVKVFDRKPNERWPRGRTVIVAGDQVIYDSPKKIGARAYDPRWPERWHPYIYFRWEGMIGNIYGRSLLTKLLPKIKRINQIDTSMIMWRRTVPLAGWIIPKGTHVVEDFWQGGSGRIFEFDPKLTGGAMPQPIYPPPFPSTFFEERNMNVAEMESIAGTEEILRGQRPVGVNSAMMVDILRKQALASRSAILSKWDESVEEMGSALLQETIRHVNDDPTWLERIKILAREKHSRLSISTFSGTNLSDNVQVRVDTASMALVSKEAREAKALEFLQFAPGLMGLPLTLRQSIVEELGFSKGLTPQGPDVERAKRLIAFLMQKEFDKLTPLPDDDPYVFHELLVNELKADTVYDMDGEQFQALIMLIKQYRQAIQIQEEQALQMQMLMASIQNATQLEGAMAVQNFNQPQE